MEKDENKVNPREADRVRQELAKQMAADNETHRINISVLRQKMLARSQRSPSFQRIVINGNKETNNEVEIIVEDQAEVASSSIATPSLTFDALPSEDEEITVEANAEASMLSSAPNISFDLLSPDHERKIITEDSAVASLSSITQSLSLDEPPLDYQDVPIMEDSVEASSSSAMLSPTCEVHPSSHDEGGNREAEYSDSSSCSCVSKEIVVDVLSEASLNHQNRQAERTRRIWRSNRAFMKRARSRRVKACQEWLKEHKIRNSSNGKDSTSGTSNFSWHNLPFPEITDETMFAECNGEVVPIILTPTVTSLPKVNTWTAIPKNCFQVKEKPSHIPYFEDKLMEKERKLIDELTEAYKKLFIANKLKYAMEDIVFYEAVQRLQQIFEDDHADQRYRSKVRGLLPSDKVFKSISRSRKGFGTPDQVKKRYISLFRAIDDRGHEIPDDIPIIDVPNLDEVETEKFSREKALNNFRTPDESISPEYIHKKMEGCQVEMPCGTQCYSHAFEADGTKKGDTSSRASIIYRKSLQPFAWSHVDGTMYESVEWVLPGNHCAIARVLLKPCYEVYQYALMKKKEGKVPNRSVEEHKLNTKMVVVGTKGQKTGNVWSLGSEDWAEANKRDIAYKPCFHPGISCNQPDNICSCRESKTPCEKFCGCAAEYCKYSFIGCGCKTIPCNAATCVCFLNFRECDPDLCKSCGASEHGVKNVNCKNVSIQKMIRKKIKWAKSDVADAGWGIFAGESILKDEFIYEYTGELINRDEAHLRGLESKIRCHTYLFELNDRFTVDASKLGSKMRFANHSSSPNTTVKVMKVNTDHRIGVYANRNIEAGEEIFLSYEDVISEHDSVVQERETQEGGQFAKKRKADEINP